MPFSNFYGGESIAHCSRIVPTRPIGAGVGVTSAPVLIKSAEQLRRFLEGTRGGWQWSDALLEELFETYDMRFFENRVLAAGVVSADSGSTSVTVSDVVKTDTGARIMLRLEAPAIGTTDMMSWHYFVELLAGEAGDGELSINLPLSEGKPETRFPGRIVADR